MKVFSTFVKIVKRNKTVLFVYLGVTLALSFLLAGNAGKVAEVFEDSRQPISILDDDGSEFSEAFTDFMSEKHNLLELEDDVDSIQDALYYDDIVYLIRIPEGFGQKVLAGEDAELLVTSSPNSAGGVYVSRQIENFIQTFRAYRAMGCDTDEALSKTKENLSHTTEVTTLSGNIESSTPAYTGFLQMMPYGFISILIHCIGSVMIAFNEENVSKRTRCSSKSQLSINSQIIFGSFLMTIVVYGLFVGVAVLANGSELTGSFAFKYYLLNSAACALCAMALGFLCGVIAKNGPLVSILGVSVSMVTAFLGGVFVPLSVMGEGIKKVSQFVPTYWYISNCEILLPLKAMTDAAAQKFMQGVYIQFGFAAAIIAIAFCVSRLKNKPLE